jgi:hypothetical protein
VTATRFGAPGDGPVRWREIEVEVMSDRPEATRLLEAVGQALREAGATPSAAESKLGRLLQSLFIAESDRPETLGA